MPFVLLNIDVALERALLTLLGLPNMLVNKASSCALVVGGLCVARLASDRPAAASFKDPCIPSFTKSATPIEINHNSVLGSK